MKTRAPAPERGSEAAVAPAPRPRSLVARLVVLVAGLGAFLIVTILLAANIGAERVPLAIVVDSAQRYFAHRPPGPDAQLATIFWQLRLPRVALGAIVGLALTVAGGSLQGLLMNPLADPYLIGVSAGAAFGASAAVVLHLTALGGGLAKSLIGFVSGALTMLIVLWLARSRRGLQRDAFILAGVVVGSFLWALVTLLMTLSGSDLYTIVYWLMGTLSAEGSWTVIGVAAALVIAGCIVLYSYARDLNVLALGEEQARHLGVETEKLKLGVVMCSALVTAAAVSVSGIIGFVGLVVPHIARKLFGPDHRLLLPAAGLLGAAFLVWADTLARAVSESFPVGVLTSLLGAPFFFYLLKRPRVA